MGRLRLKLPSGTIEKLQVEDDCTLQVLQETVVQTLGLQSSANVIKLSLNKKAEIQGKGTDSLRSLGICSGDTLWLMSAFSDAAQSSSTDAHVQQPPAASTYQGADAQPHLPDCHTAGEGGSATDTLPEAVNTDTDTVMRASEQAEAAAEASIPMAPDFLQRVIDSCQTDITNAHQLMMLAMHAVLLETGLQVAQQQEGQYSLPAGMSSSFAQLEYSLQQQPDSPACEVKYFSLGSAFACVAAHTGNTITTINVSLQQHVDLSLISLDGAKQNAAAAFKQLPQLWMELKDGLALKLVAALRQQAGLEPLLGLLSLPSDLKHNILGSLQAKALAALACCCTELRHTASSEALWQRLFEQEFGYVTHYENIQGSTVGWPRLFARRWVEREEMRAVRRRMHCRHVGPQMPYGSPQIPPGPPGLNTGGDYDRLPQPFLGGTPGMFGGPLGSSHGFGGQGPPASFFLGGSRSSRGSCAAGSFRLH